MPNCVRARQSEALTSEELEKGTISILTALRGKYQDIDGEIERVSCDFTKVKCAANFDEAGKRILQNLEHASKQNQGTMEVRKQTRYETNAGRIRRGVSIFVTFSPDEKHNVLMLRLRRSGKNKMYGQRQEPPMDNDYLDLKTSVEDIGQWLPKYDDRRAIVARDPLASVDGFHVLIRLVCEYIFWIARVPQLPRLQPWRLRRR